MTPRLAAACGAFDIEPNRPLRKQAELATVFDIVNFPAFGSMRPTSLPDPTTITQVSQSAYSREWDAVGVGGCLQRRVSGGGRKSEADHVGPLHHGILDGQAELLGRFSLDRLTDASLERHNTGHVPPSLRAVTSSHTTMQGITSVSSIADQRHDLDSSESMAGA